MGVIWVLEWLYILGDFVIEFDFDFSLLRDFLVTSFFEDTRSILNLFAIAFYFRPQ